MLTEDDDGDEEMFNDSMVRYEEIYKKMKLKEHFKHLCLAYMSVS